ncbi:hypothetical protein SAMN05444167_0913 [Terriglobus roseus]|uniref:Uncharacterized protein n=1 Tax=Terriglobus roseus TaxID=392734 RepID=A0A1G7H4N8_9BACT|nr:hypothetical protein SAMN05444167_0913 [Terriglobus roseus]
MLRLLDSVILIAWYGFVLCGSIMALVRMSRGQVHHGGQAAGLPERWRRWMLDERIEEK